MTQALNFPSRSSSLVSRSITGSSLAAIWVSTVFVLIVDKFVDMTLLLFRVDKSVDIVDTTLVSPTVDIVDRAVDVAESSLRMRCAA